jgi:hypothetical protein
MGRRRRQPNSGEPAALPAGEEVGHDHVLTYGLGMAGVGAEELPERAHGDGQRWRPRRLGPGDGKRLAWTTSDSTMSYWVQGRSKEDWAHWRMDGEVSSPAAAQWSGGRGVGRREEEGRALKYGTARPTVMTT